MYKLLAFNGASPYEVIPINCVVSATFDGISCPANATQGQALQLLEPNGADYWRIKVRGAMNVTRTNYVEADGSISGMRLWMIEESEPATPGLGTFAFYAAPKISGYAQPMIKADDGYVYKLVTLCDSPGCGATATASYFPEWNGASNLAHLSDSSIGFQHVPFGVGFGAKAGMQFFVADAYDSDTPTGTDCDNVAEVGRIAVRSGSSVSVGKGGLCSCAVETGSATPAWRCPNNP
jgi:hypothetical protein